MELLVHLSDMISKHVLVDLVDDFRKIGRSIKLAVLNGLLVAVDYLRDTVDTWVKDITV